MKIYLYPTWLRIWHWLNALLFLVLIVSGVSLHYSDTGSLLMPFDIAIASHNIAGLILTGSYLFFVIGNFASGNYKQYLPQPRGIFSRLFRQAKYYLYGIFKGDPHPYEVTRERKFNPLQQIAYLKIMYVLFPALIVSGWFLLFPETAPEEVLGMAGILPMATAHAALGFFLSLFMVGHIYLATTGKTVGSNFKAMMTGWHEHDHHEEPQRAEPLPEPTREPELAEQEV
ncbi:MAG: cytochrome B [Ectothiorhodospiraceae bacterium]|nr:cytochrome B [Ectothiorhodospiraceae bacterium]